VIERIVQFLVIVNDRPSVKMVFSSTLSLLKFLVRRISLLLWNVEVLQANECENRNFRYFPL